MPSPDLAADVPRLQQRKAVLLSRMRQLGQEELSVRCYRLHESEQLTQQIECCKREVVVINLILESGNLALWNHYKDTYEVANRECSA